MNNKVQKLTCETKRRWKLQKIIMTKIKYDGVITHLSQTSGNSEIRWSLKSLQTKLKLNGAIENLKDDIVKCCIPPCQQI